MIFPRLALNQVNRAATTLEGAAGKSINVAKALAALGENPLAIGFLGGDSGELLRSVLTRAGVEHDFITTTPSTRTCITVIDQATQSVTELVEESAAVPASEADQLEAMIRSHLQNAQALVMSGTIAPGLPENLYFKATLWARESGALSVVDAKGPALELALAAQPDLVKPNRIELATTVGRELHGDADVKQAMNDLIQRGAQQVVVTAGKDSTLAFDGETFWRITAPSIEAVNPIGSGDAFTAGLVWRLLLGDDLGEACRWGCAAGCANALNLMAGEIDAGDVDRLACNVTLKRE